MNTVHAGSKVKPHLWVPGANPDARGLWQGCVGCWPLWEGCGDRVFDVSGYGNFGSHSTPWGMDAPGAYLDFDVANSDEVVLTQAPEVRALPFSVFVYARFPNFTQYNRILDYEGTGAAYYNVVAQVTTGGAFMIDYGDGTGLLSSDHRGKYGATALTANTWYALGGSCRGASDMSVYVNGIDDAGSYTGTGVNFARGTAPGFLGSFHGATVAYSAQDLAFVALWNRDLSAAEHMMLAADPFVMLQFPRALE